MKVKPDDFGLRLGWGVIGIAAEMSIALFSAERYLSCGKDRSDGHASA